jgi:hypothetical protein
MCLSRVTNGHRLVVDEQIYICRAKNKGKYWLVYELKNFLLGFILATTKKNYKRPIMERPVHRLLLKIPENNSTSAIMCRSLVSELKIDAVDMCAFCPGCFETT